MSAPGPNVRAGIGNAGLGPGEVDDRGLQPLAAARALVAASGVFAKGEVQFVNGSAVTDADRLWGALLSLADAEELVAAATRLRWEFHVRGRDNTALVERYGAGILPWLASRLDARGVLMNVPWCVVPCLLAIDAREAFAIALGARAVHELLPGQNPLGGGPGLFAADAEAPAGEATVGGPEDAQGFAGTAQSFDLAASYLAAHPGAVLYALELAGAGDARALAFLREPATGAAVAAFDALEARDGHAAAQAALGALGVPVPSVPPEVQEIFDESELSTVPRGPRAVAIATLDAAARDFDFPLWDNLNVVTTASRVRGFVTATGDVLCVEAVQWHAGAGDGPDWTVAVYASRPVAPVHRQSLIAENDVETLIIDDDRGQRVDGYSNILLAGGHSVRDPFAGDAIVKVMQPLSRGEGEDVTVPVGLPPEYAHVDAERGERPEAISPVEALLVQIDAARPGLLFPTSADLMSALELGPDAEVLFDFTDVAWPAAGEPVSSSIDFVAMVAALKARRRIRRLPGDSTSSAWQWLAMLAEDRACYGEGFWPEGNMLAPVNPADGVGATPVDSRHLASGWPHGTSLVHGEAYNARGSGAGVVAHWLTPGGARWFMNSRVGAAAIVRAAGSVKQAWTLKDKGIAKALKTEGLLEIAEAAALVAAFVAGPPAPFARIGGELVFVLEALIGPRAAIEAVTAAVESAPAERWRQGAEAVAAACFELGVLLRRAAGDLAPLRERLEALWARAVHPDVTRVLDLVLHGRAGAERSARCEGDYLYAGDGGGDADRAWAAARILDPATPASVEDLALLPIAGDALLQKYLARIDTLVDRAWLAAQLPKAGTPTAATLAARLA